LSALPWELLPDPAAGRHEQVPYLALAPDTHVIRQARGRTYPMRTTLLEAPLNLLLVFSSPTPGAYEDDSLSFDIFEIKRNLLAELSILKRKGLLHVEVVDRPTADNLRQKIGAQSRGYHLFHYVGHAVPEGLILEDRAGYRFKHVREQRILLPPATLFFATPEAEEVAEFQSLRSLGQSRRTDQTMLHAREFPFSASGI